MNGDTYYNFTLDFSQNTKITRMNFSFNDDLRGCCFIQRCQNPDGSYRLFSPA